MADVIMVNGEAADVPAILASKWGHSPAAGYVTGGWPVEWSEMDFARFARKIRVDQAAALDPAIVRVARVRDFEPGAGGAASARAWLGERASGSHFEQSTAYAALATVPGVVKVVGGVREVPRWWLAWWWNRPGIPTRAQVLVELKRLTGVDLPPDRLWACQYRSDAQWELSVVYGDPDFDR